MMKMTKFVYCAECGTKLQIFRKAMPKYNCIIDIVNPHICLESPAEFDLKPDPVPQFIQADVVSLKDKKFVRNLYELQPEGENPLDNETITDRRPKEHLRSEIQTTAPRSVLEGIKRDLE
jgi:hypothetical protein